MLLREALRLTLVLNAHVDYHQTTMHVVHLHHPLIEVLAKPLYHHKPLSSTRALSLREVQAWRLNSLEWKTPRHRHGGETRTDHRPWNPKPIEAGLGLVQIVHLWTEDRAPTTIVEVHIDPGHDHLFLLQAVRPCVHSMLTDYLTIPTFMPNQLHPQRTRRIITATWIELRQYQRLLLTIHQKAMLRL